MKRMFQPATLHPSGVWIPPIDYVSFARDEMKFRTIHRYGWVVFSANQQRVYDSLLPRFRERARKAGSAPIVVVLGLYEPIDLRPAEDGSLPFHWIVISGETAPVSFEALQGVIDQAKAAGVPVWMQESYYDAKAERFFREVPTATGIDNERPGD